MGFQTGFTKEKKYFVGKKYLIITYFNKWRIIKSGCVLKMDNKINIKITKLKHVLMLPKRKI